MVELYSFDDVGQGYDIALGEPERIATTLGRHPNDMVTSFYLRSPSGFMLEYGWGGREVDTATWEPTEVTVGPSLWGHDRLWLPPNSASRPGRCGCAPPRPESVPPVQVMEGKYRLADRGVSLVGRSGALRSPPLAGEGVARCADALAEPPRPTTDDGRLGQKSQLS